MLFYESQRSGPLPADNRVAWRGPSDLTDGADHGLDLTGGYHDAGDEVKFGLPEAYSMTTLAWGGLDDKAGYQKSGQWQYLERNLRWGDDYIIKAHPSPHVFYGQVGDGSSDHIVLGAGRGQPRTAAVLAAVTESCPGSDLVGQAAAALAASSIVFQTDDPPTRPRCSARPSRCTSSPTTTAASTTPASPAPPASTPRSAATGTSWCGARSGSTGPPATPPT